MEKKRLVLIFPPFTMPTSPPLGIAMLKGYIESELPNWDVELLDLNLWLFQRLLTGIEMGQIGFADDIYQQIGADAATLVAAGKYFSGEDKANFYQNPQLYDYAGGLFIRFTEVFVKVFHEECHLWETTQQLSPLLAEMCAEIDSFTPDIIGISMIFSDQLPIGAMLGRYQRQQRRRKVLMGGSCFTEGVQHFLNWYPEATDVVVTGDGEYALKQLLLNEGKPEMIPGTSYFADGTIKFHPPVFDKDIDEFGIPNFSGLKLQAYYSPEPVVPLLLSRGCYWRKCSFCVHYFSAGDSYRLHSLERVITILQGLVAQGISHFSFVDEMIAPGHFVRLAKAIKEANLDIAYYALSKPNKTFTAEILEEMAESGCKYILWGVESGNQRVLDLMGKGTQKAEIAAVLKLARSAGIANHVYIICGFPTETEAEWAETIQFLDANKANIYAIHRGVFSLEEGSPIHKDLAKFSITETWVRQQTPLGARLGYRCSSGLSMEEARVAFQAALPFLKQFNPYARYLANYRDHALLIYRYVGNQLDPESRVFPAIEPWQTVDSVIQLTPNKSINP